MMKERRPNIYSGAGAGRRVEKGRSVIGEQCKRGEGRTFLHGTSHGFSSCLYTLPAFKARPYLTFRSSLLATKKCSRKREGKMVWVASGTWWNHSSFKLGIEFVPVTPPCHCLVPVLHTTRSGVGRAGVPFHSQILCFHSDLEVDCVAYRPS